MTCLRSVRILAHWLLLSGIRVRYGVVDYVDLVLYQNVALRGLVHLVKNC